jgi:predicted ATPase
VWYDRWVRGPILGRQGELDRIEALFREAPKHSQALVLVGEPGIGKSLILA